MLSEIGWTQKSKYCMLSVRWESKIVGVIKATSRKVFARRESRSRELYIRVQSFS